MTRRLALLISIAAAAIAVLAPVAQSSAATSPSKVTNFSPLRTGAGDAGKYHAIAVNPKTGAQIAFYSADGGSGSYLATQRFDAKGPVGPENIVLAAGVGSDQSQWQYSIAYNPTTGGWFAIYHDQPNDQILGQLLKADGSVSGAPFTTVDSIQDPSYAGSKLTWDSASNEFLVTATSYYDSVMKARFVSGNGVPSGSSFDVITGLDSSDYCPMDTAYSTKSDTFVAVIGGGCSPDSKIRPLVQPLSGDGSVLGSSRYLGGTDKDYYAASVAYNSKLDEFGVVWTSYTTGPYRYYAYLQRIDASDGSDIGSPVELTPPEGLVIGGLRPRIASSPVSGNYYFSGYINGGTSGYTDGVYSFQVTGTGSTVPDSLDILDSGLHGLEWPQVAYNPVSGRFLTTYTAAACVPAPVRAPRSNRGDACTDFYNLYSVGASSAKASSKPSIKKLGTAGGTSARVKLGCGGSGKCKIELSGKLVGGSGKVVSQTVKLKAGKKATVTVDYSQELIDQLAARGGGKIKLTAKQVGGKSSSIVLVVPSSVTG